MKKSILLILCLTTLFQTGCKNNLEEEIADIEDNEVVIEVAIEDKVVIDRSEDISDYVVELFGIDDSATIIFNDIALVSVIMAKDSDFTEDVKELITDLVMDKDKGIRNVIVSNDEKTFSKIVEIIGDLLNGVPYDNHVATISKIIDKNK